MFQCASFTKWPITGTFTLDRDNLIAIYIVGLLIE